MELDVAADQPFMTVSVDDQGIATVTFDRPEKLNACDLDEHDEIADYAALSRKLAPLRAAGLRLTVDDAGAGFASFRHILQLAPDVIKLDASLIRQIDTRRQSRALAAALVRSLRYIAGHSAEDLARLAPPPARDDAAVYVAALRESKAGFTADGAMPPQGPETAMRVLTVADRAVRGKRIDLARTWTGEFVADVR